MISLNKETVETRRKLTEQESAHPVIEAIKRDAATEPEKYVRGYKIPAEGE